MSQKVPKTAKHCIFEVFGCSTFLDFSQLLKGFRRRLTSPRASPLSKESSYPGPFFMKIKSRKVITAFMSKNDFASHRKRIHFCQPWFEGFRSSLTLLLFVALSPTSYLTIPTRVRPYSTWLVIYSSFCAPTGVKKGRKQQKSDACVYTPRIP